MYALYREIKKSQCTWCLQYRKLQVMFKVSPRVSRHLLSRQGDTRLTLTPSIIPNSKYVIMISDWNCLKYFCVFLYCNYQVHRDFLITLLFSFTGIVPLIYYQCMHRILQVETLYPYLNVEFLLHYMRLHKLAGIPIPKIDIKFLLVKYSACIVDVWEIKCLSAFCC
jgi:hypothetical protein